MEIVEILVNLGFIIYAMIFLAVFSFGVGYSFKSRSPMIGLMLKFSQLFFSSGLLLLYGPLQFLWSGVQKKQKKRLQ